MFALAVTGLGMLAGCMVSTEESSRVDESESLGIAESELEPGSIVVGSGATTPESPDDAVSGPEPDPWHARVSAPSGPEPDPWQRLGIDAPKHEKK
jgi:hypothetical protein